MRRRPLDRALLAEQVVDDLVLALERAEPIERVASALAHLLRLDPEHRGQLVVALSVPDQKLQDGPAVGGKIVDPSHPAAQAYGPPSRQTKRVSPGRCGS